VRYDAAAGPGVATTAAWMLLLAEGETVTEPLRDAIAAALRGAPPDAAWRIALEVGVPGGTLRPARAPIRLAPRGAKVRVRRDGGVELRAGAAGRAATQLEAPLAVGWPGDLATAVVHLDADAAALAALLGAAARRASASRLVAGGIAAAATALVARASGGGDARTAAPPARVPFAARWAVAVLAGYRVAVAQAKLWESGRRVPGAVA
jgi:hypothetical protein